MDTSIYELTIPLDLAELAGLRSNVRSICIGHGVPSVTVRRTVMAVDEAVTNIIEHSSEPKKKRIALRIVFTQSEMTIELSDEGSPFDPTAAYHPPSIATFPRRGFGLYLIHMIADGLEYRRTRDGKNILIMRKLLDQRSSSATSA